MSILRLDNVTRRFGGLVALENVSLEVSLRGITAIIGPNGAGKTTLFNIISGFNTPTTGSVFFDGENITALRPSRLPNAGSFEHISSSGCSRN